MDLTISKEKVREAAEKCPTAKEVLQTLFPQVFQGDVNIPKYLKEGTLQSIYDSDGNFIAETRTEGEYASRGIYLSGLYDWKFVQENLATLTLVPTKKYS